MKIQNKKEGWEEVIMRIKRPSKTTRSGYEVTYDPEALIEQTKLILHEREEEMVKEIEAIRHSQKTLDNDVSEDNRLICEGWNHALDEVINKVIKRK